MCFEIMHLRNGTMQEFGDCQIVRKCPLPVIPTWYEKQLAAMIRGELFLIWCPRLTDDLAIQSNKSKLAADSGLVALK